MVVVYVHGAGSNAGFWHRQREAFPGAVYVDLPGHGGGKAFGGRVSLEGEGHGIKAYVDAVAAYIGQAGFTDVLLNGHSMGGAIVQTLALSQPVWLRGLILTGTGARLGVSPLLLSLLGSDYPAAVERIVEWSFARVEGEMSYAQRISRNGVRRQLLRTPQAVTLGDYASCDRFDATARLGEIRVPTLAVVGADDRMTRPRLSEELHAGITNCRLRVIEGAGHMLPLERAEEYNTAIGEFIGEVASDG